MSGITTHVLDIAHGQPARNVAVRLEHHSLERGWLVVTERRTDVDGRVKGLIADDTPVTIGRYRLTFSTGEYFGNLGVACFHPEVQVTFEVLDAAQHYHVPLLVSPYGYSTYRGS
jgi:5-hydroxyisourate hydrolase